MPPQDSDAYTILTRLRDHGIYRNHLHVRATLNCDPIGTKINGKANEGQGSQGTIMLMTEGQRAQRWKETKEK